MEEELSQVQTEETQDFDDWSVDDTPVATEESEETTESVETTEPEVVEQPTIEEPFLKVNFLKEEKGLTREEAKNFAEKGMNYDRLRDKYNALNEPLEKLARANGKSIEDFVKSLNDVQREVNVSNQIQTLLQDEKYQGVNEDILREIAEARVGSQQAQEIRNQELEAQRQEDAKRAEVMNDIDALKKEFPEWDMTLPQSVMQDIRNGMKLQTAYYKYLLNESVKQNSVNTKNAEIDKFNQSNKSKSYGNTIPADDAGMDDFLAGWNDI